MNYITARDMRVTRVSQGKFMLCRYRFVRFGLICLIVSVFIIARWGYGRPHLHLIRRIDANMSCYSSATAKEHYGHLCGFNTTSIQPSYRVFCRGLPVVLYCTRDSMEILESCFEWTWDVANKTLSYNADVAGDFEHATATIGNKTFSICIVPTESKIVRKIIRSNSSIEFPGCARDFTETCEWPFYDKSLRMRINTDPCCRYILMNMTNQIGLLLDQYSVHYILISGAVIGWVRNKAFVPYDHDIDIIIDIEDKEKFEKLAKESFTKLGYELQKNRGGFYWIWPRKNHIIGPDVWYFSREKDVIVIAYGGWKQPISNVFPRQRGTFEGYKFWFPAKPVEFLDTEYGKDKWRTPLDCTRMEGKTCT